MGFFDRFKKPTVRRYEYADTPIENRSVADRSSVDRTYQPNERIGTDRVVDTTASTRENSGWLWLLLIPLFLLLGLGAYSYVSTNNAPIRFGKTNVLSRFFNNDTSTGTNNTGGGMQFGVGGAPATPTPTISTLPTSTPTLTPVPTSGSVQSATTRQIPQQAPSTGRGGGK